MANNTTRVRIQSISMGNQMPTPLAPDGQPSVAKETFNVALTPVDNTAGAMPMTLVVTSQTGLTVGKEYDLTLTPAA